MQINTFNALDYLRTKESVAGYLDTLALDLVDDQAAFVSAIMKIAERKGLLRQVLATGLREPSRSYEEVDLGAVARSLKLLGVRLNVFPIEIENSSEPPFHVLPD